MKEWTREKRQTAEKVKDERRREVKGKKEETDRETEQSCLAFLLALLVMLSRSMPGWFAFPLPVWSMSCAMLHHEPSPRTILKRSRLTPSRFRVFRLALSLFGGWILEFSSSARFRHPVSIVPAISKRCRAQSLSSWRKTRALSVHHLQAGSPVAMETESQTEASQSSRCMEKGCLRSCWYFLDPHNLRDQLAAVNIGGLRYSTTHAVKSFYPINISIDWMARKYCIAKDSSLLTTHWPWLPLTVKCVMLFNVWALFLCPFPALPAQSSNSQY